MQMKLPLVIVLYVSGCTRFFIHKQMNKPINITNYPVGTRFTATVRNKTIKGRLNYESNGDILFCQDMMPGAEHENARI